MKVLITGITGMIGKELGKRLTSAGIEVVGLSRSAKKAKPELPFPAEVFEWDGKSKPAHVERLGKIDAVVNLMGENLAGGRWTAERKRRFRESRVEATKALVAGLGDMPSLKVWVQGSAIGYYGVTDGIVADENSPRGEGYLAELCEAWEGATAALPAHIRQVTLRTGVVFSHRGGAFEKMVGPILQGLGGSLGSGLQRMSLIHLDDVTRFIEHALNTRSAEGPFNLVCHEPISQNDLNRMLCQALRVRTGPSVPAFALRLLLGEMASIVLDDGAVMSRKLNSAGFNLQYPAAASIVNECASWHLPPVPPAESLNDEGKTTGKKPEKKPEKKGDLSAGASGVSIAYAEQFFPMSPEKLFEFFQDPLNLEAITPKFLNFKVISVSTSQITQHTKIEYQLKLHGVPLKWLTDIREWNPPHSFVDHQEKGPYTLWHHVHRLYEVPGGTRCEDWVRYALPLGKPGSLVASAKVRSDVTRIFNHRRQVLAAKFGDSMGPAIDH